MKAISILFLMVIAVHAKASCPDLDGSYVCPQTGWDRGALSIELKRQSGQLRVICARVKP